MSIFGTKLKKFDVHVKVVDGVGQQTSVGAVVTLVCLVLTALLAYSELRLLLRPEKSSHVVLDQVSSMESVKLNFDVVFHKLSCSGIITSTLAQSLTHSLTHSLTNSLFFTVSHSLPRSNLLSNL
jgi:hypothetical protein